MRLAHKRVPISSSNASLPIAALHQLRDGHSLTDKMELADVTRSTLTDGERSDLVSLASRTGALEPMREVLESLGVGSDDLPPVVDTVQLREWRARISADASGAYFWMLLLEQTPPRERLGVLSRALWPPRGELLINDPGIRDTFAGRTAARLARFPQDTGRAARHARSLGATSFGGCGASGYGHVKVALSVKITLFPSASVRSATEPWAPSFFVHHAPSPCHSIRGTPQRILGNLLWPKKPRVTNSHPPQPAA